MGTLPLNSFFIAPQKFVRLSKKHDKCLLQRKTNTVYCKDGGNAKESNGTSKTEIAVKVSVPCSTREPTSTAEIHDGIGIFEFFKGKKFLITGATGFLAKVLIEKMLRTMPDVDKIFLVIKAKNKEVATERLKKEIINGEVFKYLRQNYGKSYQAFMFSKLIPVVGNVCESNLGLEEDLIEWITEDVDVIVNSAANTTFDERYDTALDINTRGPGRMLSFAKKCKKLKLFLHVSTAYVSGGIQGRIMENKLCMGDSIGSALDIEGETKWVQDLKATFEDNIAMVQRMKELGLERAKKYGWQNTYVFTKAMGEMLINDARGDIPVVIIRPTVVESTYINPFPGWIEGNRMMDPIVLLYGKGHLTGFPADPNGVFDVVPADMVVNATLATIAKHGGAGKSEVNVYHIASSVANPLIIQDLTTFFFEHFKSLPCLDSKGRPILVSKFKHFTSMEEFSSHLSTEVMANPNRKMSQRLETLRRKSVEHVMYLANIYKAYAFYGGRFDNSSTQRLMECLSEEERSEFGFDVGSIDWKDYITNIHIPGLRRHVMKERETHD